MENCYRCFKGKDVYTVHRGATSLRSSQLVASDTIVLVQSKIIPNNNTKNKKDKTIHVQAQSQPWRGSCRAVNLCLLYSFVNFKAQKSQTNSDVFLWKDYWLLYDRSTRQILQEINSWICDIQICENTYKWL